ncbi:hypothetical protein PAERUG_E16_London_17_VIM_2_04_14_02080 [Pseudomonas aeruginosa]|nr:hypothetical protein PAERUG_E16_London_17_VIM_2_04_14_02080 [Pseudomonas aeruginosa]
MGRVVHDLDVEHGGQAAQALGTDAQLVDLLEQLQAQFLDAVLRAAGLQFVDVDRVHEDLLRHHRCFLRGTADADAEHARRAPAGAHGRYGLQHPVDDRVGRVEHGHLRLVLRAAALGRDIDLDLVAGNDGVVDHRRRVVLGVLPRAGRVGQDRGAQDVLRQVVGAAHAFVDHIVDAHGSAVPAHVHADPDEHGDDPGVLADRAVAGGAHARVDQDLRHGVAGSRRFFAQVGLMHGLDEIDRVVVGDELQGIGDALDQVVLLDHGHGARSSSGG